MKDGDDDLRFSGYTAWRGTVPASDLPPEVVKNLRTAYPDFGNCLYFIWGPPGKSAVLYDIGKGLINWLVYDVETCPNGKPKAPPGRTTTTATPEDIQQLQDRALEEWGPALRALIQATPNPFQNDIYDIKTPLASFVYQRHQHTHPNSANTDNYPSSNSDNNGMCILGDAAHPISPHCAKGSNLAIHDAYVLACAAQNATSVSELLQTYSSSRVEDCRTTVLLSRHLGRLRNRMAPLLVTTKNTGGTTIPDGKLLLEVPATTTIIPTTPQDVESLVRLAELPTFVTLPRGSRVFDPTWEFIQNQVPKEKRGYCLSDDDNSATTFAAPLAIAQVNHISLETTQVDKLVGFYQQVLGLSVLPTRPNFGFGGAWLQLPGPGGMTLHVIECDPVKPPTVHGPPTTTQHGTTSSIPERFIRRSHHVALTVLDIEQAEATLRAHHVAFAINKVPDTCIEQLFLYDPDGNGIEIGNFGLHE
jgi:catechol 2,3-dioxygenase-like lactoylglutathione lyase family enzyme